MISWKDYGNMKFYSIFSNTTLAQNLRCLIITRPLVTRKSINMIKLVELMGI
jgi:hypothetical protein